MGKVRGISAGVLAALFLAGCSAGMLEEKNVFSEAGAYGVLSVETSDEQGRSLDINEIKAARITVSGDGMTSVTKDCGTVSGGKGSFTVDKIPVGKNRVIVVEARGSSGGAVAGFSISAVTDIQPGNNAVTVSWATTGTGNVYKELLARGEKISSYTPEQNEAIKNAVPAVKGYFVDSAAIASDFIEMGGLKNSAEYVLSPASLSYAAVNASGWTVTVCDPCSESKTLSSDGSGSVAGIAPGEWTVVVTDGTNVVSSKKLTFAGGRPTDAGTIGNPLAGKTIIFVKCAANTKLYSWTADSESELSGGWDGTALTESATSVYMNNPDGWYMMDVTAAYGTSAEPINIILISGSSQSDDLKSGIAGTLWYDGTSFYDSDPTANQLSSDATLASISVNGKPVEGFSAGTVLYNAVIAADAETAVVTAAASDSGAAVSVSPSDAVSVAQGNTETFTITVTAADGKTEKTYTVSVKRAVENDVSLASVAVNGKSASASGAVYTYAATGSDESFAVSSIVATPADPAATVTYSPTGGTVADGGSAHFTITVKNGAKSAAYTLTVTYTRKEIVQSQYYWTNKDGAVGTNKTISSWSDWTENEKIVQGAANDDPRVFAHWSMHENPNDAYALYAAYDATNLYLMVELTNVQDIVAPGENYPLSDNGQFWNRGTPFFFAFETGKGVGGDGKMVSSSNDKYVWGSAVEFTDKNIDTMLVTHSSPEKGTPGIFYTNSNGLFDYNDESLLLKFSTNGVEVTWDGGPKKTQGIISPHIWGIQEVGTDQGRIASNLYTDTYIDFNTLNHNTNLDLKWQIKIPLSVLRISFQELKSDGIGVIFVVSDGASGMDCLPWDSCMIDVAEQPYSKDESSSAEKEDIDTITVPLARIGHM